MTTFGIRLKALRALMTGDDLCSVPQEAGVQPWQRELTSHVLCAFFKVSPIGRLTDGGGDRALLQGGRSPPVLLCHRFHCHTGRECLVVVLQHTPQKAQKASDVAPSSALLPMHRK